VALVRPARAPLRTLARGNTELGAASNIADGTDSSAAKWVVRSVGVDQPAPASREAADVHRQPSARTSAVIGAQSNRGQPDRHVAGVVRLLHLRDRRGSGLQSDLLSKLRATGRHFAS